MSTFENVEQLVPEDSAVAGESKRDSLDEVQFKMANHLISLFYSLHFFHELFVFLNMGYILLNEFLNTCVYYGTG